MIRINLKQKNIFENLLILFILIQPFIDLATSLAIKLFNSQFTAGILIRFAMMIIGIGYIFFFANSKKKKVIIYLSILSGFLLLNFINNLIVKTPFSIGEELKFILKSVYFVVLFFSYLYVFKNLQTKIIWSTLIQKYVSIAMTIVGLIMIIADLTNTAFNSYSYNKVGHTGWFYAGNEISAIMSICFPLVVLYGIKQTKSIKSIIYWIPTLFLIYSLMAVGTKVGFGSVLITLLISFFMLILEFVKKKKEIKINLIINFIVLVLFALYIPFSPIAKNTSIHLTLLKNEEPAKEQKQLTKSTKTKKEKDDQVKQELNDQQFENLVLSGRGDFLKQQKKYFSHAPISQKVLGMGYAGNYKKSPKMIEMDFYDLFFSFGIIGFILYFLPFIILVIAILKKVFLQFKLQFSIENILVACGIALGMGIAFTAGHVLTAPAVSIYLAVLIAYLYMKVLNPPSNNK